jgi:hypothetical protein
MPSSVDVVGVVELPSEPLTADGFLKMQLGVEQLRSSPTYKSTPIVDDFWRLIEGYRTLLLHAEKLETGLRGVIDIADLSPKALNSDIHHPSSWPTVPIALLDELRKLLDK